MTEYPTPVIGDKLIMSAYLRHRNETPHVNLHGVEAEVIKITPTGLMDLKYKQRDLHGRERVSRSFAWNETDGCACEKVDKHMNCLWIAYHPSAPKAVKAIKEGLAAFHAEKDVQIKGHRDHAVSLATAAVPLDFNLSIADMERVIAGLMVAEETNKDLIAKFKGEIADIRFQIKEVNGKGDHLQKIRDEVTA